MLNIVYKFKGKSPPVGGLIMYYLLFQDVNSLQPLCPVFGVEADRIAFGKRLEPVALDGRIMNKYVCSVFSGNETVALGFIKPLHCPFSHSIPPYFQTKAPELKRVITRTTKLKVFMPFTDRKTSETSEEN
jgi:hypothetical protein